MALNCKPGQIAWIEVPKAQDLVVLGLTQLHGHVVRAERLLSEIPGKPMWLVEPRQHFRVPQPLQCPHGEIPAGTLAEAIAIPDSWLRPFEDFQPEDLRRMVTELSHA